MWSIPLDVILLCSYQQQCLGFGNLWRDYRRTSKVLSLVWLFSAKQQRKQLHLLWNKWTSLAGCISLSVSSIEQNLMLNRPQWFLNAISARITGFLLCGEKSIRDLIAGPVWINTNVRRREEVLLPSSRLRRRTELWGSSPLIARA